MRNPVGGERHKQASEGCMGCLWTLESTGAKTHVDTKQDPVGLLGMEAFLCPPFLDYRK